MAPLLRSRGKEAGGLGEAEAVGDVGQAQHGTSTAGVLRRDVVHLFEHLALSRVLRVAGGDVTVHGGTKRGVQDGDGDDHAWVLKGADT